MAVTGAVIAGIGTAVSISNQKKIAREQEKQLRAQRATELQKRAFERRKQLRERRIKQGQLLAAAAMTGTLDSSGQISAESAFSNEFAINTALGNQLQASRAAIDQASINIANAQLDAAIGGALQDVGLQIVGANGGFSSIFKTGNTGG